MNRNLALRLIAIFCSVLLPILLPSDVLAQRKLLPVKCTEEEWATGLICIDSIFVEEGTVSPDSCVRFFSAIGRSPNIHLLFSNSPLVVSFQGLDAHADEFNELSKAKAVIDSTRRYLLVESVRQFLHLLEVEFGLDDVRARSVNRNPKTSKGPYQFGCFVERKPQHYYNIWKVMQLWALAHEADTADVKAVWDAQYIYTGQTGSTSLDGPMPPCLVFVSSVENNTKNSVSNSPSTYVFEQSTSNINGLRTAIRMACGGVPEDVSFALHAVTGQAHSLSSVAALHSHLQSTTPGVYSLRVADQSTGACSVLVLVVR
jgi:hypothetical protein